MKNIKTFNHYLKYAIFGEIACIILWILIIVFYNAVLLAIGFIALFTLIIYSYWILIYAIKEGGNDEEGN